MFAINKDTILAGAVEAAKADLTAKQTQILARVKADGYRHWGDLKPGSETHRAITRLVELGLIDIKQSSTVATGHVAITARPTNA